MEVLVVGMTRGSRSGNNFGAKRESFEMVVYLRHPQRTERSDGIDRCLGILAPPSVDIETAESYRTEIRLVQSTTAAQCDETSHLAMERHLKPPSSQSTRDVRTLLFSFPPSEHQPILDDPTH